MYLQGSGVRVKVLNATFNNMSAISRRVYWWRKLEYPKKTIDLPHVTDKLHDIILYLVLPAMIWMWTLVVRVQLICDHDHDDVYT